MVSPASIGTIPIAWILTGLTLSAFVVGLAMVSTGLTLAVSLDLKLLLSFYTLVAATTFYHCQAPRAEWQRVAYDAVQSFSLIAIVCLLGTMATYPAAAASAGFADADLARADRLLGLNWLDWYRAVAEHPMLQRFERAAYECIYVSPLVLLGYFAATGRKAEARLLIASFWLAAVATVLLFMLVPAVGPLAYLTHGPIAYLPESAIDQAQLIPLLRERHLHLIDIGMLRGLVSAPSFHAASAVLYIAAAWRVKPLRWPLLAMNVAMLLATPVEGTHYFIDLIAGAIVAAAALTVMRSVARRCPVEMDLSLSDRSPTSQLGATR